MPKPPRAPVPVRLSSYLGDRLHKALKLYLYNRKTNLKGQPVDWINHQLDAAFQAYRTLYKVPAGQAFIVEGWTDTDIRTWVVACLGLFIDFLAREDVVFYFEEWDLDNIYLDPPQNTRTAHLGCPDLVGFSRRRNAFLVLDHKNASHPDAYRDGPTLREVDKLLGYAFGARQRYEREHKRKMKVIVIGFLVFVRHQPPKAAELHLLEEPASPQRLGAWRKRALKKKTP